MYNDIVTTVGKDNGSFLVLLDLSAAFDTIDHDNLFYILEKYDGIGGSATTANSVIFLIVNQEFKLMVLCLMFQVCCVGCHRAQFLEQLNFVCICSTWCDISHHNIDYHIYADDTQLYISFKCKDPLKSLTKLNMCISDILVWMINYKLKINYSKTKFIYWESCIGKKFMTELFLKCFFWHTRQLTILHQNIYMI